MDPSQYSVDDWLVEDLGDETAVLTCRTGLGQWTLPIKSVLRVIQSLDHEKIVDVVNDHGVCTCSTALNQERCATNTPTVKFPSSERTGTPIPMLRRTWRGICYDTIQLRRSTWELRGAYVISSIISPTTPSAGGIFSSASAWDIVETIFLRWVKVENLSPLNELLFKPPTQKTVGRTRVCLFYNPSLVINARRPARAIDIFLLTCR